MTLIISYDPYESNWYVGELYKAFHEYLQNKKINIEYISMANLAKNNNEPINYNHRLPSIFSIYSLIVINKQSNIGFVHNLSDYAPLILDHKSAIDKLNINTFSMCSNLTQKIIDSYPNYKIIPSFYVLENWNDLDIINSVLKKNKSKTKTNKCYFNGLLYNDRIHYMEQLKDCEFFDINNKKNKLEFKNKIEYYQELYNSRYGLSLNGAAKICYRDLELFGIESINLREPLDIIIKDSLQENIHYKIIIDKFIEKNISNKNKQKEIIDRLLNNIHNISLEEENFIINNAKNWFIKNAYPINQIKFLEQCLIENNFI